jgi:hypothetical protein
MNKPYEEMTDEELSSAFAKSTRTNFATCADAILPWLEKRGGYSVSCGLDYGNSVVTKVSISSAFSRGIHEGVATGPRSFARAACIALIKANETP